MALNLGHYRGHVVKTDNGVEHLQCVVNIQAFLHYMLVFHGNETFWVKHVSGMGCHISHV